MKLSKYSTPILSALAVLLCCCNIILQKKHDDLSPPFQTRLEVVTRNLLPSKLLPYVDFGFTNILASYYWLSAVQDFTSWDGKDLYFLDYFKNISTLDPKFEYPYLFSIVIIPQNKNLDVLNKVAELADKGIQAIPESWKIPFYLGTQYYIFTNKKLEPALRYLEIAAGKRGAPDGVYLVYSSFTTKKILGTSDKNKLAQSLIKVIYNTTDDEIIKKIAAKGLQENIISQLLESSILAYKTKYGKYPKTVEDIMAVKLTRLPEGFLEGFTVVISQKDGSFKVLSKD